MLWPDGPAGWIVLGVAALALAWWAARALPKKLFRATGVRRLADRHGWLVKFGGPPVGAHGDLPGGGLEDGTSWQQVAPDTHYELLGHYQGYVFHVRETNRRVARVGRPGAGGRGYRTQYDYVVALAPTNHPYDGFFTADKPAPVQDWRYALYPAFLEWERGLFDEIARSSTHGWRDRAGLRRGPGLLGIPGRDTMLSKKALLTHLDELCTAARQGSTAQPE